MTETAENKEKSVLVNESVSAMHNHKIRENKFLNRHTPLEARSAGISWGQSLLRGREPVTPLLFTSKVISQKNHFSYNFKVVFHPFPVVGSKEL